MAKNTTFADEISALSAVLIALEALDDEKKEFVLRTAMDRLGIGSINTRRAGPALGGSTGPGGAAVQHSNAGALESLPKDFIRAKQPITDVQRIACLAYYLSHARETGQFKTLDLTKLNTEAAGAKFSNAAVAVNNATLIGLLAAAGGGKKQITALGEDVVKALPDQEGVKAAVAATKKNRRRRKHKKASAKKG
jgi:hypothetical protein